MTRAALLLLLGLFATWPALAQAPQAATGRAPVPNIRAPLQPPTTSAATPAPASTDKAAAARPGAPSEADQSPGVAGTARVVDGDTLRVDGRTFRLWGIDAPELVQACERDGLNYACGRAAAAYLRSLLTPAIPTGDRTIDAAAAQVVCEPRASDQYGRVAALCRAGTMDLGAEMVRAGWAMVLVRHGTDYAAEEEDARANLRGLWAGAFDAPWEWRAKRLGE
ncbi:MAG: thermonuclease family protein [Reyranella sp.]|nr:thermonuclease family protein [Reyranella sp.]MDP3162759.1 thermonuclease family protein [Reyranella sp.]